jgi:hypothetical protein
MQSMFQNTPNQFDSLPELTDLKLILSKMRVLLFALTHPTLDPQDACHSLDSLCVEISEILKMIEARKVD